MVGSASLGKCSCGGACAELMVNEGDETGFFGRVPGAFAYPLRRRGLAMLAAGVLLLFLVDLTLWIPLLGLIVLLVSTGYYLSFLMQNVADTAGGRAEEGPEWPSVQDLGDDTVRPFFRFVALVVLSFGPALAALIFGAPGGVQAGLLVLGLIYAPMAFMGVSVFRTVAALDPRLVVPSILRIPGQYLVAALLVLGLYAIAHVIPTEGNLVAITVGRFAALYLAVVETRILGLLYRANQDVLGWF